jgi:ABC-2 type transport system ATP-binding protein
MTFALEVEGLTKVYAPNQRRAKPVRAVDGISFGVQEGEIFGFLGPNGAGKTTTIRMLTGLTRPTSGSARILDFDLLRDVTRIKKLIGVVPEASNLYDELTTFDNLVFSMQLYGVPRREWKARAEELLSRFRLSEKRDAPFAKLSRGMKRALTIAAALAHRPPLIFLDEPTTGLDVMSARSLRQMIAALREQGVTVFLTTHYLEEAERLCDRVAVIVKGRVVALDTVDRLRSGAQRKTVIEVTLANPDGQQEKRRIECDDGVQAAVRSALAETNGRRVLAVNTLRPSLEDVFVQLTGLDAEVMLAEKGGKGGGNAAG